MSLPIGTIILWETPDIPEGWNICDGNNGTPNLINRFIYGASNDGQIMASGGTSTHTHSTSIAAAGGHNHTGSRTIGGGDKIGVHVGTGSTAASTGHTHTGASISVTSVGSHTHSLSTSGTASNIPTYITKCFIMKTS